jgi:hypothetical protein
MLEHLELGSGLEQQLPEDSGEIGPGFHWSFPHVPFSLWILLHSLSL